MKKILSVILAATALFTLAACKVKPSENKETEPYRPEEFQAQVSQLQAERASELAEQQKEKDKLNKEIDDYIAEIGKTKKGKELVLEISSSRGREYQKYVFNKKGEAEYRIDYLFYNSSEDYEIRVENAKKDEHSKLIEKDRKTLMVVVKVTNIRHAMFDELYEACSKPEVIALGYKIVE